VFSKEELAELERQLSCPEGAIGLEVAENMNESNISMTLAAIEKLDINSGDRVLEIGHGNCKHLLHIHEKGEGIDYCGLEISQTMHEEAKRIHSKTSASFVLYDGNTIPFEVNSFDKVFTVNTIYFWKDAISLLQQIEQVLKPNGCCVIAFAQKSFMKNLPFVDSKFQLYDEEDMRKLVASSKLKIVDLVNISEIVQSKSFDEVKRDFIVVKLTK